jgi:glutathione synthase/RimK-type ligase-like ATP-grasp enzyme
VGQKYLLEAIGASMVQTDVFYDKKSSTDFLNKTSFPKVFKLRGGAGSSNVKLIKSKSEAQRFVNKAFGSGFPSYDRWGNLKETWTHFKRKPATKYMEFLKSLRRLFVSTEYARLHGTESGYVLFQEFIPNNTFDIRVVVIGGRAFALKRLVRKNDFRASGSGFIEYDKDLIDERCVSISFDVAKKLKGQCVAYDFVFDTLNNPLIVEINYGFAHEAYFKCPGYWDEQLNWHSGNFNSAAWMVELMQCT